jgi:hypothetical protein
MPLESSPAISTLPEPDQIRQTAQEVLGRSYYKLDEVPIDQLAIWARFWEWFSDVFGPVARFLGGLFDISPWLGWGVVAVLVTILVAIIVHLVFTLHRVLTGGRRAYALPDETERRRGEPEHWEQLAREAAAELDYIRAVRCLFRACLLRLEAAQKRTLPRGATNREYLKRFGGTPAHEPLTQFVSVIDTRWYSGAGCSEEDLRECMTAHSRIKEIALETAAAHST